MPVYRLASPLAPRGCGGGRAPSGPRLRRESPLPGPPPSSGEGGALSPPSGHLPQRGRTGCARCPLPGPHPCSGEGDSRRPLGGGPDHGGGLGGGAYPGHEGEDAGHQLVVVVAVAGAAGVADDDEVEVEIARGEGGGDDADVGGAAAEDDGVDAAGVEAELEVGGVEGAPAVLGDEVVVRLGVEFRDDLRVPVVGVYVEVGPERAFLGIGPGVATDVGVVVEARGVQAVGGGGRRGRRRRGCRPRGRRSSPRGSCPPSAWRPPTPLRFRRGSRR